jgi:hypothetical protein
VLPLAIGGAVHEVKGSDIEKSAAAPDVFEVIASRDPDESLTRVAPTPSLTPVALSVALLTAVTRSFNVSIPVPLPIWKVCERPDAVVKVKEDGGRAVVGSASALEYHAAVLARLFTTTVWVPETVPVAAVAVRSLLLEEVTVLAARGPVNELRFCISVARASVAV